MVKFEYVIYKLMSVFDDLVISREIALRRTFLDLIDDKLISVQVMTWCRHQAIIWANIHPDLFHHMASLDHDKFKNVAVTKVEIYEDVMTGTHFPYWRSFVCRCHR